MAFPAVIAFNDTPDMDLVQSGLVNAIEVHQRLGETTYYSIELSIDIQDGEISLLDDARFAPGSVISIFVQGEEGLECLVKGPVYAQDISIQNGGQGSTLTVKGGDNSLAMDREFKSEAFTGIDDTVLHGIFAAYSLLPDIGDVNNGYSEDKHTLIQRGTDLQFVRQLARRNGMKFWISCDEVGLETGHFKFPDLSAEPSAELKINLSDFNINNFSLSWDVHRPGMVEGLQVDLNSKDSISSDYIILEDDLLGSNALQTFAPDAVTTEISAPVDDSGALNSRLQSALRDSTFFVKANCQTSLHRLGKVLHAHNLVSLSGAGSVHSGKYLLSGVQHRISESSHDMDLELLRNATGPSA